MTCGQTSVELAERCAVEPCISNIARGGKELRDERGAGHEDREVPPRLAREHDVLAHQRAAEAWG